MPALRLLIADDSLEFRKSIRSMLAFERDLEVVLSIQRVASKV